MGSIPNGVNVTTALGTVLYQLMGRVKQMEQAMQSLTQEVDTLRAKAKPDNIVIPTAGIPGGTRGLGNAIWNYSDGSLLEHNQAFLEILGCQVLPFHPYNIHHFLTLLDDGEPECTNAYHRLSQSADILLAPNEPVKLGSIKRKFKKYTGADVTCSIMAYFIAEKNAFVTVMYEA